jgi:hypothetical protein
MYVICLFLPWTRYLIMHKVNRVRLLQVLISERARSHIILRFWLSKPPVPGPWCISYPFNFIYSL